MNNYDKYKFLKEELKAPRFIDETEEIQWFTTQLYGLYKQSYRLREENKQLNEMFEDSKTYSKEFLYNHNKNLLEANKKLQQQRDLYKKVIEEVREYINTRYYRINNPWLDEMLQVLDKGESNE
jgi:hypothetical protein